MKFFLLIQLSLFVFQCYCHKHSHESEAESSGQHEHPSSHLYEELTNMKVEKHEHEHVHDHEHSHEHVEHHSHDHHLHENNKSSDRYKTWLYALSSVVGISVAPCLLLFFIPAENANGPFLKVLLAFGAGGLLGDAILHIIPHALHPHNHHSSGDHSHAHAHSHSHDHAEHEHDHSNGLRVGVFVIAGIISFMIVEQFVRIAKGGHCHSHENGHVVIDERSALNDQSKEAEKHCENKNIKASAYLNLVADFVHNLTDGLAIGASFTAGNYVGMVTTLTVLLHELPHEVGDFAILVQSGFSKSKAIRVQLVTALGALTGCVISLLASDPSELASGTANSAIMPFTAGGFIYIATVSVIPELLDNESSKLSKSSKICQSIVHVIAILIGVGMMYCVAFFE